MNLSVEEWSYIADSIYNLFPVKNLHLLGIACFCGLFCMILILSEAVSIDDGITIVFGGFAVLLLFSFIITNIGRQDVRDWIAKYAKLQAQLPTIVEQVEGIKSGELVMYDREEAIKDIKEWEGLRYKFNLKQDLNTLILTHKDQVQELSEVISIALNKDFDFSQLTTEEFNIDLPK